MWAGHCAAAAAQPATHTRTDRVAGAVLPLARRALVPDLVVAIAGVADLDLANERRLSDEGNATQLYLLGDDAGNGGSPAPCVPQPSTAIPSGANGADGDGGGLHDAFPTCAPRLRAAAQLASPALVCVRPCVRTLLVHGEGDEDVPEEVALGLPEGPLLEHLRVPLADHYTVFSAEPASAFRSSVLPRLASMLHLPLPSTAAEGSGSSLAKRPFSLRAPGARWVYTLHWRRPASPSAS